MRALLRRGAAAAFVSLPIVSARVSVCGASVGLRGSFVRGVGGVCVVRSVGACVARRFVGGVAMTAANGNAGMPFAPGAANGAAIVDGVARFGDVLVGDAAGAVPVEVLGADAWDAWYEGLGDAAKAWLAATGKGTKPKKKNCVLLLPSFDEGAAGALRPVVFGLEAGAGAVWGAAEVAKALPSGTTYAVKGLPDGVSPVLFEIGWGLAAYGYKLYKSKASKGKGGDASPRLVRVCKGRDAARVDATLGASYLVRDLITTPTEDMGPASLSAAVFKVAELCGAECSEVVGDDLLREETYFPQVHSVGRAATETRAPRLVELKWNPGADKTVALVGKGVCYDTGGLSLKNTTGMLQMKKDMGGAAHVLALAYMIMKMDLPIGLRVLIPAVENAVGPSAYRPGDVIVARNKLTTEVTNTDAEGRLILADALVAACEESPELVVDFATLTGAQRIALGPDIPSFWATHEDVAATLTDKCTSEDDLMWRLPLHKPYRKALDSSIADVKNCGSSGQGSAITAALYLQEFVAEDCSWIHVDLSAYNLSSRSGRPEGGEAMGLRATFALIESLCGAPVVDMGSV